jgi:hypothetical protein
MNLCMNAHFYVRPLSGTGLISDVISQICQCLGFIMDYHAAVQRPKTEHARSDEAIYSDKKCLNPALFQALPGQQPDLPGWLSLCCFYCL